MNFTTEDKQMQKYFDDFLKIPYFAMDKESYFHRCIGSLCKQIKNKEFRITVVGEYSAGKSTFLNALIGKDILPHAVDETTATITYIHNVSKDDSRLNKIHVHFYDPSMEVIHLDFAENPDVLKNYTTTKSSERSVVNEIDFVDIYVHFSTIDEPIVFVDTPGLNGVAKGHRERTIQEIKQAHASVCLFHLRSISSSNLEFLKILSTYQQSFIFVMNFIDELKRSEGESYEGKIESFNKDLRRHLFENNETIDLQTYGISALKALVAKDLSIKRLYQDDVHDLTKENREQLWSESKFGDFEQGLWKYVVDGEKNRVFHESIVQNLHVILGEAMEELHEFQKSAEMSVNQQQKVEIQGKIARFEKLYERNWEKVIRFISSRENDLEKAFRQRIEEDIENVIQKLVSTIKVASFDEFEDALKTNQYGRLLVTNVGVLKSDYHDLLADILEEIYQSAIVRIREYNPTIHIDDSGVAKFQTIQKEMEQNFTDLRFESKLEKLKGKRIELEIKQQALKQKDVSLVTEITKTRNEEKKISDQKKNIEAVYQQKKNALGSEPPVKKREVQRTITVERAAFSLFRLFGSDTKEETVWETVTDRSERDAWARKKETMTRELAYEKDELEREAVKLKGRLESLSKRKLQNKDLNDSVANRLKQVEKDINRKKEEYTEIIQKAKSEYLQVEKKKLVEELSTALTDEISHQLKESVKNNIRSNIKRIIGVTQEFYNHSLASYRQRLELLVLHGDQSKDSQKQKIVEASIKQLVVLQQEVPKFNKYD